MSIFYAIKHIKSTILLPDQASRGPSSALTDDRLDETEKFGVREPTRRNAKRRDGANPLLFLPMMLIPEEAVTNEEIESL
jgi:hypothetical protein